MITAKRVKVSDDWHPSYEDGTIRVAIKIDSYDNKFAVRVYAHGNDDFGLERVYGVFDNIEEANSLFCEVKSEVFDRIPEITNKEYYRSLEFKLW